MRQKTRIHLSNLASLSFSFYPREEKKRREKETHLGFGTSVRVPDAESLLNNKIQKKSPRLAHAQLSEYIYQKVVWK
jgi:hypothetical protein